MEGDYVLTTARDSDTATVKMEKKVPTLKECILSTMYLMEVAWIAILQLRFTYFLVSLNPWLHWRNIDGTCCVCMYVCVVCVCVCVCVCTCACVHACVCVCVCVCVV